MLIQGWGQSSSWWFSFKIFTKKLHSPKKNQKILKRKKKKTHFQLFQFLQRLDPDPSAHSDCHTETQTQKQIPLLTSQPLLKHLVWLSNSSYFFFFLFVFYFFFGVFFLSLKFLRKKKNHCRNSVPSVARPVPLNPNTHTHTPCQSTKQSTSRSMSRFFQSDL